MIQAVVAFIRDWHRDGDHMYPWRVVLGLILTITAVSCSACSEPSSTSRPTVVDSAGVRIVTNESGSIESAQVWSLSATPAVAIGTGANPDVPLFKVSFVLPLDRDRVAVATNSPSHVRIFEGSGTLVATLGREGEGPGEFSNDIASVVALGEDSLAVWDRGRRRMWVFTEDGRYMREVDLSGIVPRSPIETSNASEIGAWTHLLPSARGSLVLLSVGFSGPGLGVRRVEVPSYRITTDGAELTTLGPFPGVETFLSTEVGLVPFPFGADTHGVTFGDALIVGTAEVPQYDLYGRDGELEQIVRWPDHDRTVGGQYLSDWTAFVDSWLGSMSPNERAAIRDILDRLGHAERFPAYGGLIASDAGEIWVGAYPGQVEMPGTPLNARLPERRWLVFGADGALVATVQVPEGFQPHTIRERRIWGVFRDELDIESVHAYELEKH
jgi:hypothetical protein